MAHTWIQQTKNSLQATQSIEKAIVNLMLAKDKKNQNTVLIDHKIKNLVSLMKTKAGQALTWINDQQAQKNQEMAILAGQKSISPNKAPDVWHNFYQKLKAIRQYHKKYPMKIQQQNQEYFIKISMMPPFKQPIFSLQQGKGKYLDLHEFYNQFINLQKRKGTIPDYVWYLQNFHKKVEGMKQNGRYREYLQKLVGYLKNYWIKVQPLQKHEQVLKQIKDCFEQKYQKQKQHKQSNKQQMQHCEDCNINFKNKNVYVHHLVGKKHQKNVKLANKDKQKLIQNTQHKNQQIQYKHKHLKQLLFTLLRIKDILGGRVLETLNLIRKKQTKDYQEIQEQPQLQIQQSSDDQPIYNPKNLPLGWDGKPIPYWLYKLHGLGVQYKCEICGNYSYWGRKAFQRHFQQWRHAYGMKCLQIPNTVHFKDVTKISDAIALHTKLLRESQLSRFRAQVEQQFEDQQGNIMNRKTYQDLKKQGLL